MIINSVKSVGSKCFSKERRAFLVFGAAEFVYMALPFHRFGNAEVINPTSHIIKELVSLEPLESPLLIFHGYQNDPDSEIKNRIAHDVATNKDLVSIIQKDIGSDNHIEIAFERLESELLFVPEFRQKYADAYRTYCINVIDYLFSRIGITVPIDGVVTLQNEYPEIPQNKITAFIVHRLGKKYKAVCTFTNTGEVVSRKFKIEGAFFSGQLGSVALEILCPENDVYILNRKGYTLWQNNTDNLVNILTIPIEETLHYIMGHYTDKKIADELKYHNVKYVSELRRKADHWMSVEEAVVGGLVHALLPDFAKNFAIHLTDMEMQLSFLEKSHLPQYKFRKAGIELVKKIGYQRAISMYKDDPSAFARLINA